MPSEVLAAGLEGPGPPRYDAPFTSKPTGLSMWQKLMNLVEAARGRSILVVGDFMLDRYLYGDAERISPEAPVPVLRVVRRQAALGGAGSVAANIAALGCRPHCVGIVGDDDAAGQIRRLLDDAGADAAGLITVRDRPTTRKTRLVGLAQHRHRQQLIRVDDERAHPADKTAVAAMLERIGSVLEGGCRAVCLEDYRKGAVGRSLTERVIAMARDRSIPVLVDPAPIADYRPYHGATLTTPNRTETERLIGRRLRDMVAVSASAEAIRTACGTDWVCVTLDADGAALISADGSFEHVPTRVRDVYDVTGAGDEVLAAIAVAMAGGGTMREAVMLANIAGGLEVEKFGCVPISRDEIVGEILAEHQRELGKVRTLEALLPELTRRRSQGDTIAFTNGCFDLLHLGHVRGFAFCRRHADILVVGLNSDASVRRLDKGTDRPFVAQDDRAAVLAALADVDYVVLFDDDTPESLIKAIRPDVLVKGADYADRLIVGRTVVESYGGRVELAPLVEGRGTSNLIRRIREAAEPPP